MKRSYSAEEVAAQHLPVEWKDRVRWLKRRLASGEIPGKKISHGVWRMTDDDVATWLESRPALATKGDEAPVSAQQSTVSFIDGLSRGSRARISRAQRVGSGGGVER